MAGAPMAGTFMARTRYALLRRRRSIDMKYPGRDINELIIVCFRRQKLCTFCIHALLRRRIGRIGMKYPNYHIGYLIRRSAVFFNNGQRGASQRFALFGILQQFTENFQ